MIPSTTRTNPYIIPPQAEDAEGAKTVEHAEKLRSCGIRVDFLLALTFAIDMWEWKTWEVVQYLVKPATEEEGRCRFADLPTVKAFSGAATIFMSHTWGSHLFTIAIAIPITTTITITIQVHDGVIWSLRHALVLALAGSYGKLATVRVRVRIKV